MKNVLNFARVLGLVFAASVGLMAAGSTESIRVTFTEPVSVGSVTLPAGVYVVRNMATTGSTPVLQFHSEKGVNASVIVEPLGVQNSTESKLVLKEVNNKLTVEQVWLGEEGGFEIFPQSVK